jgi:hypothetical protein
LFKWYNKCRFHAVSLDKGIKIVNANNILEAINSTQKRNLFKKYYAE